MATRRAWLMNLDADEELAAPQHYRPIAAARITELTSRMRLLLAEHDIVVNAENAANAKGLPLHAFCATPWARGQAASFGLALADGPSLTTLQRANHRAFCAEVGQTLTGARYVRSMAELLATLQAPSPTGEFVLKRPFGFAGRERRRARGDGLDPSTHGFAMRTFAQGEGLQVEPWLERERDFSLHGYLHEDGRLCAGPLVQQHCDGMGRWQHSELAPPAALSATFSARLEHELHKSARALQQIGYFGPFGIDAFEYRDHEGTLAFQPRSEINARFTMGYPRELLEQALPPLDRA